MLQVPSDGRVASLRRLLDDLDAAGVEVEQLSIHTPDLDDVFFAITGQPTDERRLLSHDHPRLHRYRFGHDAAPKPPAPACATRR